MEILAIIPARKGSKGIPHKNIAPFNGKPLLAHSIIQAKKAKSVTRVIVSTDSEIYAAIAREYGAETPFIRPDYCSEDHATDLMVFHHALNWLKEHEQYFPDICVHLRPTFPTRLSEDIDKAVKLLISEPEGDSVRTVVESPETPFKMWFMDSDGFLKPIISSELYEPYNMPRQSLLKTYLQNANIDVVWTKTILEKNSMTGQRIKAMVTNELYDIDNIEQLKMAERASSEIFKGKKFVFDLDGIIATLVPSNDYNLSQPIYPAIALINQLFDNDNFIEIFTARGSKTGKDWSEVTRRQLTEWGVRYHRLSFGKPYANYYIDDRLISIEDLRRKIEGSN